MKQYNKLVRDRIPRMIEEGGETPVTRILETDEYLACLEAKLDEEVSEFHESKAVEELADILEVVYTLAEAHGYSKEDLGRAYQEKHDARGGFSERIFLIGKTQKEQQS